MALARTLPLQPDCSSRTAGDSFVQVPVNDPSSGREQGA
ncbi:hypothetical protein ARZXY2_4672 (plasmid) [Arthrobacter sp. ZXY-2]|nr:hypothetical protein ARZXY2_4672 [Arthrobacter sp. ZXY-2]